MPDPLPYGRAENAAAAFVILLVLTLALLGQLYEAASDALNQGNYAFHCITD
jgi:hypothetical protein